MGSFAAFTPIPTPTLPLKGREFAVTELKLVPLDPEAVDSRSVGVIDNQRRVIGKALRFVDSGRLRPRGDAGRGDLVIDTPADILGPSLAAIRPPGVCRQFGMHPAKHVDKTGFIE